MKRYLSFIFLIFIFIQTNAKNEIDSLLQELDQTISNQTYYMDKKEATIKNLKLKLSKNNTLDNQYHINNEIIKEYHTYLCDSAISYIHKNIALAKLINNQNYKLESQIQLSRMLTLSGLFTESLNILSTINPSQLPPNLLEMYYSTYSWLYDTLGKYSDDDEYTSQYKIKTSNYLDSVFSLRSKYSLGNNIEQVYKLFNDEKYEDAVKLLQKIMPEMDQTSHLYAIAASRLAYLYSALGEKPDLQKKYLIIAATIDLKHAIKENSALLNLAILINQEGDIDRAYKYIRIALEDANFYNSRHRNSIIAKVHPIIEKAYLTKIEEQKTDLQFYLILVSILVVGLVITTFYVYKQIKIVSKAKKHLKEMNKSLDDANHIKEEYIGYFLNQCSIYVNKLDEYKQQIYRKIKAGQIEDLTKMISTTSSSKKDIEELYKNFDAAFLKLYPNFVSDFNLLLKEDDRYKPKSNELNTELRIFALIRLGISDNKQISSFLRYSIQTIYNYRSKVRGKTLIENEDFEEKVKKIGLL